MGLTIGIGIRGNEMADKVEKEVTKDWRKGGKSNGRKRGKDDGFTEYNGKWEK